MDAQVKMICCCIEMIYHQTGTNDKDINDKVVNEREKILCHGAGSF